MTSSCTCSPSAPSRSRSASWIWASTTKWSSAACATASIGWWPIPAYTLITTITPWTQRCFRSTASARRRSVPWTASRCAASMRQSSRYYWISRRPRSRRRSAASAARIYRLIVALRRARVQLARPTDTHRRVRDHFLPVRHPAYGARDREHHREHRARNTERRIDDSRVEIDVRVQLARDEVLVLERRFLQALRQLEQRVVLLAEFLEHLVAHVADDLGARIEVLVDAVAEAHEAEVAGLVLGH